MIFVNHQNICINLQFADFPAAGGRLNMKDGLTRYGNSHVKDKTS